MNNTPENKTHYPSTQAAASDTPVSEPSAGSTSYTVDTIVSGREMDAHSSSAAFVSKPNTVSSVAQFLAKPIQLASGSWDILDPAAATLYGVSEVWSSLYNVDVWSSKLKGYLGLRGTMVVELKLNATPFQQGRLKLSYYPMGQRAPKKVASHFGHRIPISQLPGIEMSASQESVTLRIPYITPARYLELTSPTALGWGSLFLSVMCPLASGASNPSTSVAWSIWCHLEDVELVGQTDQNLVAPQSGLNVSSKRGAPAEREQPPVSGILSAAGNLAGQIGRIPGLAPAAGTAQWALSAAKNAASAFGFSRPNPSGMTLVTRDPFHYGSTADGMDVAMPMSVLSDAKLVTLPGLSPSGQDEMSLQFIGTQWSFFQEFPVLTTNNVGTLLATIDTTPRGFRNTVSPSERYLTPLAYLGMMHYWHHGGVEVMFKLVKTGFHTGTLSFTFVPGVVTTTPTLTTASYCYRNIVDLQKGDSVCLELPWMTPLDYLKTSAGHGKLFVHVVNALRAPETVAQFITVQVYVRAAKDKQWQAPVNDGGAFPVSSQSGLVDTQGGETEVFGEAVCETVGGAPSNAMSVDIASESASEMPLSLRQYCKRYTFASTTIPPSISSISINPYVFAALPPTGTGYTAAFLNYNMSRYAAPFAFARGGMRIRMISPGAPSVSVGPTNMEYYALANTSVFNHTTRAAEFVNVQIPYTSLGRFTIVEWTTNDLLGTSVPDWHPTRGVQIRPLANVALQEPLANTYFQSSGSDDFELFYFVGIPRFTNTETFL